MTKDSIFLVWNAVAEGRQYALYKRGLELASVQAVRSGDQWVICVQHNDETSGPIYVNGDGSELIRICIDSFVQQGIISSIDDVSAIATTLSIPSSHFLSDRLIGDYEIDLLSRVRYYVPHLSEVIDELTILRSKFPNKPIIGVSDSSFHSNKPDYTWNYGINLDDADQFDIKRFGYNGVALEAAQKQIKNTKYKDLNKVIVCHLGDCTNVTAIYNGKSIDTTTGYVPSEGLINATGSGTIDFFAGLALAKVKNTGPDDLAWQLTTSSGLQGISGLSGDLGVLLNAEHANNHRAGLAVTMFVYAIRQAIARMTASLEGVDMLLFTGSVAQQLPEIRHRIVSGMSYLGLALSPSQNVRAVDVKSLTALHPRTRSKPILLVPLETTRVIAGHTRNILANI